MILSRPFSSGFSVYPAFPCLVYHDDPSSEIPPHNFEYGAFLPHPVYDLWTFATSDLHALAIESGPHCNYVFIYVH